MKRFFNKKNICFILLLLISVYFFYIPLPSFLAGRYDSYIYELGKIFNINVTHSFPLISRDYFSYGWTILTIPVAIFHFILLYIYFYKNRSKKILYIMIILFTVHSLFMSINFPVCESPSGWKSNGKSLECIGIKKYQLFEVECIGFIGESIKDKPLGFFDKLFFSHFFSKKLKDNKDHTLFYESLKNGELDTKKDIPIDKIFKEKMK